MTRLRKREFVKITPSLAKVWGALNTFSSQRPIRQWHLRFLCEEHRNDDFNTGHIAFASNGKDPPVLMNGQHQLKMVIIVNKPITAVVEHFNYDIPSDLSELFRKFDSHAMRSLSNMVKVEHDLQPTFHWSLRISQLAVTGLFINSNKSTSTHRSRKVEMLSKNANDAAFIAELFDGGVTLENRHLARGAVVAAMLRTAKVHKNDSRIFWRRVTDGAHLKRNAPEAKLRNFLMTTFSTRGGGGLAVYRRATDKEILAKCIHGWNAFRKNRPTDLSYRSDKPTPKLV